MKIKAKKATKAIAVGIFAIFPASAVLACASCGCSLSSDWDSQGVSFSPGLKLDLRYDFLNQNQYRNGTKSVTYDPSTHAENELYTKTQYFTAGIDYSFANAWGVNVQLPWIDRQHATNGTPPIDPTVPTTLQNTQAFGDARVVFRYAGFADRHFGVQWGLKLPTGSHTETFSSGGSAGVQVDPGLQPGTGSTDLLVGGFYARSFYHHTWDYFTQGIYQTPIHHDAVYKPGDAINGNLGVRYLGFDTFMPQLQVNVRMIRKDSVSQATDSTGNLVPGPMAHDNNTGGRIVSISPGITIPVNQQTMFFAFLQVPVYQSLDGFQLAPKYSVSLGVRIALGGHTTSTLPAIRTSDQ